MIKGFRDFILRGNIVDLAVAFVMGVAFSALVTSLVDNIINPIIGTIFGQPNLSSIHAGDVRIGAFLNEVISFLLIALAVYFFIVVPVGKLMAMRKSGSEDAPPPAEDIALLQEIRDLLKTRNP